MNQTFIFITTIFFILSPSFIDSSPATPSPKGVEDPECAKSGNERQFDCYMAIDGPMDQATANDECRKEGGELASIHSESDQAFVLKVMEQHPNTDGFWIGLKLDYSPSGELTKCFWTDGIPFDYGECKQYSGKAPWAVKTGTENGAEPNNYRVNETCVYIHQKTNGWKEGWVDQLCNSATHGDEQLGAICKLPATKKP